MAVFGSPFANWDPAPYLSSPLGMAAWYRREGVRPSQLAGELRRIFPEVTSQQIGKVVGEFRRFEPRLRAWEMGDPTAKLQRVQIPRQADIPKAYRYYTDISWEDRDGIVLAKFSIIIDSASNLSLAELKEQVRDRADVMLASGRYERVIDQKEGAWFEDVVVNLVGRRT